MSRYEFGECGMQMDSLRRLRAVPGLRVATEICFWSRSIDMVWLDSDDNIHAIEMKLVDWRNATYQIQKLYEGCHYRYICMPPKKRLTKVMFSALEEIGIGYLEYQPPSEWWGDDFSYPFKLLQTPKRIKVSNSGMYTYNGSISERVIELHERALQESRIFVESWTASNSTS